MLRYDTYYAAQSRTVTLRLFDQSEALYAPDADRRRFVPRRLQIQLPSLANAAAAAATPSRGCRPLLFPAAAYPVSQMVTGLRAHVMRAASGPRPERPARWARVLASVPAAQPVLALSTVVGRAMVDERGEFLLPLDDRRTPVGDAEVHPVAGEVADGLAEVQYPQLEAAGEVVEPWALRGVAGFAALFASLDSVEHRWNMWVVGYDAGTQQHMLGEWFGASSWRRVGLLMLGIVGAALLAYLLVVQGTQWRRDWRTFSPARGLERWGAGQGIPRAAQETLADYGTRLAALRPAHAQRIEAFVQASYALLYAPQPASSRQLWRLWWRLHLPGSSA